MATSPINNLHPRLGFNPIVPQSRVLTDASLVGESFERPAGLLEVSVIGGFVLTAGLGEVNLLLEGSNDGTNYVILGQLATGNYFDTNGQQKVLNPASNGQLSVGHWLRLRVRAVVVSGAPTFTLTTYVGGIKRDSEKQLLGPVTATGGDNPLVLSAGGALPVPTTWRRPAGTGLTNVQVVVSGVVLDGATSIDAVLEGSLDGNAPFQELARVTFVADGNDVMVFSGDNLINLGAYPYFRVRPEVVGVLGGLTAFSLSYFLTLDSADWSLDPGADSSGGATPVLDSAMLQAIIPSPTPVVAPADITVTGQLVDADGNPISGSRRIELVVYDTTLAGDLDLSANLTFAAVNTGTALAGLTTNRLALATDASGFFSVDVTQAVPGAETAFFTAVQHRGPQATKTLIWQADQATLTFT